MHNDLWLMESAAVEALQSELEHYDYMMAKFGVQDTPLLRQRSSIVSIDGSIATVSLVGPMMTRIGASIWHYCR